LTFSNTAFNYSTLSCSTFSTSFIFFELSWLCKFCSKVIIDISIFEGIDETQKTKLQICNIVLYKCMSSLRSCSVSVCQLSWEAILFNTNGQNSFIVWQAHVSTISWNRRQSCIRYQCERSPLTYDNWIVNLWLNTRFRFSLKTGIYFWSLEMPCFVLGVVKVTYILDCRFEFAKMWHLGWRQTKRHVRQYIISYIPLFQKKSHT